jgi:hypothetical protein
MPDEHVHAGLRPSSDRKVRLYPSQKNSFGMLSGLPEEGGTCPGATVGKGGCRYIEKKRTTPICYVDKISRIYKGVKNVLQHNTDVAKSLSREELTDTLTREFKRFLYTEAARGNTTILNYRIHWAGDIIDKDYAYALADAMMAVPEVSFWGYTRSLFSVPILAGVENVNWYISLDEENREAGLEVYEKWKKHGNIHIAWLGHERPENFSHRLVSCPVDNKKMALEGACHKCKLCLRPKNIFFKIK